MSPPDYASLIDAPTWAFIEKTASFYPPDAIGLTISQQRAVYDTMCRAFHQPHPVGVTSRDAPFGGVPCRVYEVGSAAITVAYMHGGGFVVGGLHSHDDVCAEICAATGFRVVSIDYRLAPEHRHPAHFNDCLAATRAIAAGFRTPLLLAGDSAGGALAASVVHALRGADIAIRGQVLVYPGLGGDRDKGSYLTHAHAPMLTREDVLYYATLRFEGVEPKADPTAAVLQDTDFSNLPPTLILSAECDPLADDGRDYRDAILAAGGVAEWVLDRGLVHGHLRARHSVPRSADSFARLCAGLRKMGA